MAPLISDVGLPHMRIVVPEKWSKVRQRFLTLYFIQAVPFILALVIENRILSYTMFAAFIAIVIVNEMLCRCPACSARCSISKTQCPKCEIKLVKDYAGPVAPSQIIEQ